MPADGARCAADHARAALAGSRFADVRWVASTGSTNADVMGLARQGEHEGVVVVADHQTAGRGRRDRTWVAPPGGSLLASVLLRPPASVAGAATMATSVALAEAVEQVAGVVPGLKWPNDLVLPGPDGDRKLAGILAEADWPASATVSAGWREPSPHERAVVVIGVGLNVCWPRPAAEGEGSATARVAGSGTVAGEAVAGGGSSASVGTGAGEASSGGAETSDAALSAVADTAVALNWVAPEVDRVVLLVTFLRRLDHWYQALLTEGSPPVTAEWRRRTTTLGRRVRVDIGADDVEGTAVDVTPEGHLVVETPEGRRRTLAVGDVVHLRPAGGG